MLVRERGFTALVAPINRPDEAVIAVPVGATCQKVEDLVPGLRLAVTRDPDVNMIGMIMLEPADLNKGNTSIHQVDSYVLVAKYLLMGKADAGFFLKDAFDELSQVIRKQLRVLVASQISDVRHVLLIGPRCAELKEPLLELLLSMNTSGKSVLESLGLEGWEALDHEATEFMIDLMDTLTE
jgi:phosphonate transport system substrate-binding protein